MAFWRINFFATILHTIFLAMAEGQLYNNTRAILQDKLGKDVYSTQVRPLRDQSKVMIVSIQFFLKSLVEVNDVTQSFVCNGFLPMEWTDEMVAWDPKDYGNETMLHPLVTDIWRPKIVLINTIGPRDLFGDDDAPLYVFSSGYIRYVPGALFPTSCELDLVKFPFDTQNCVIELAAMSQIVNEMQFQMVSPEVSFQLYTPHVEWDVIETSIEIQNATNVAVTYSTIKIHFMLRRRPAFLLLNIILPVVFLSFLNILVFIIPAQSGEKVGFGITVLLALAVFLSMVSTMLPRTSRSLPRVTIYLFILLVISLFTVVDSIVIVYLHYLGEREEKILKAKSNYKNAVKKLNLLQRGVRAAAFSRVDPERDNLGSTNSTNSTELTNDIDHQRDEAKATRDDGPEVNKYKIIGKYIDLVSFIVFLVTWILVTIGFMLDVASVLHV